MYRVPVKSPVYKVGMGAVLVEMHRLADSFRSLYLFQRNLVLTTFPRLLIVDVSVVRLGVTLIWYVT